MKDQLISRILENISKDARCPKCARMGSKNKQSS